MRRRIPFLFLSICILIIIILSCYGCSLLTGDNLFSPDPITELNQTYKGSVFNITVTDIQHTHDAYGKPAIGVFVVVENTSSHIDYFARYGIDIYIDDMKKSLAYIPHLKANLLLYSMGEIASGKRIEGYICVEAPEDTEVIELYYKNELIFILDVPPIEDFRRDPLLDLLAF